MTNAEGLTPEDLEAEQALALPEREAISKIGISAGFGIDNFAMPAAEHESQDITAVPYREAMSVLDGLNPSSTPPC